METSPYFRFLMKTFGLFRVSDSERTDGQSQEERQPAEDEHAHHHAQRLRCLLLSGELQQFDGERAASGRGPAPSGLGGGAQLLDLLVPAVDPQGQLVGVLLTLLHHAGLQVLGGAFGHDVDAAVHGEDDRQRDVEGPERREEGVERFLGDETNRVVLQVTDRKELSEDQKPDLRLTFDPTITPRGPFSSRSGAFNCIT